jgi:hypothetical protein
VPCSGEPLAAVGDGDFSIRAFSPKCASTLDRDCMSLPLGYRVAARQVLVGLLCRLDAKYIAMPVPNFGTVVFSIT